MMTDHIIEARGLQYRYPGGVPGLSGLHLTITRHRRLALLGANGAGKTTLLLHFNGTLRPDQGELWLHGARASYSRTGLLAWRQQVGIVFQNPEDQLFAGTVFQDISFGPLNLGLTDREVRLRVDDALTALQITELRDRPTHMLSFGQKKRVAIAGAIAMRPSLLIMDEPTAGLDPAGTAQLVQILNALHAAGTTIVLATHEIDVAYAWADDVAILAAGQVISHGASDVVLEHSAMLQSCHLRMPVVLACTLHLIARGWLDAPDRMPRSQEELLALITNQPVPLMSELTRIGRSGPTGH